MCVPWAGFPPPGVCPVCSLSPLGGEGLPCRFRRLCISELRDKLHGSSSPFLGRLGESIRAAGGAQRWVGVALPQGRNRSEREVEFCLASLVPSFKFSSLEVRDIPAAI